MFVNQLSVFIENREGRLDKVLATLKDNDINIVSLSLADTSDYGLLRMIVSDPEKGKAALKEAGFTARVTEVLAVKLAHKVGQLQVLLAEICKAGINIDYMYAFMNSFGFKKQFEGKSNIKCRFNTNYLLWRNS